MPASPEEETRILELLVLRHLYEGNIVDWPLPEDHSDRPIFDGLERKGLVARWSRMWPLRDRYRLTERGIVEIERQYEPATAELVMGELRAQDLPPGERRAWLRERGYDEDWVVLHDPYTHWETWRTDPGPGWRYVHHRAASEQLERETEQEPVRDRVEDLDQLAHDVGHSHVPYGDVS